MYLVGTDLPVTDIGSGLLGLIAFDREPDTNGRSRSLYASTAGVTWDEITDHPSSSWDG